MNETCTWTRSNRAWRTLPLPAAAVRVWGPAPGGRARHGAHERLRTLVYIEGQAQRKEAMEAKKAWEDEEAGKTSWGAVQTGCKHVACSSVMQLRFWAKEQG